MELIHEGCGTYCLHYLNISMMKRKKSFIQERFGNRVKELRTAKGWSQERLADECKLHRTYIGGIERGERNVSLRNLNAIAKAFDLTLKELFDF